MASRMPRSLILPTATMESRAIRSARVGSGDREARRVEPESLDIVETAGLFLENVDHDVAEIEQHPRRRGEPFHRERALLLLGDRLFDRLRQSVHLPVRSPRHQEEKIGVIDLADDIEDFDGQRLLLERLRRDDEGKVAAFLGPRGARRSSGFFGGRASRALSSGYGDSRSWAGLVV